MNAPQAVKVLFVCMGNICRSPTAQGVLRKLVRDEGLDHCIEIDSAGTHAYHLGEPPDPRAQETARARGIDLSDLRARQVEPNDFGRFHYVVAMDHDNYARLRRLCPPGMEGRLHLLMDFAPDLGVHEVPDPYYGGQRGFEQVFDLIELAARGLLDDIKARYLGKD
ncbi:low molecular weight phosphotyrosine protein phosphatase [Caldichromatium japonicum]|uniref:protein-tyrosine-phosphatase n=1 Tax=Caldichromatium japonicum TaxID=2699430 RepID=A0A6G7VBN3_9GAMM|nr:low molecular weight protein-tyrosine-phosphatase [Caldichromatium japonicum]QIK37469.1 low molecular weight phosphotyrosine protein phosphatase [Caldichromatium japonicum]